MSQLHKFEPDLIVEATAVCDRRCAGCYAPNLFSKKTRDELITAVPQLFLSEKSLRDQLDQLILSSSVFEVLTIRGGEPTQHPHLGNILEVCTPFATKVYLETHGRWILNSDSYTHDLLRICTKTGVIIKLSFDQMHGLGALALRKITGFLTQSGIYWVIAITEETSEQFEKTREACSWVASENIVFHKKSHNGNDLVKPKVGVIHVDGTKTSYLNMRPEFVNVRPTAMREVEL